MVSSVPAGESLSDLADSFLLGDLTWKKPRYRIDYSDEYKRSLVETLLTEGSVETQMWQLTDTCDFGTADRHFVDVLNDEGTYRRVFETGEEERTETMWVFYINKTEDEPPSDATVVSEPPDSLSEMDRRILASEMDSRRRDEGDPKDFTDMDVGTQGQEYRNELDASESALVPSPPFDYVEIDGHYYEAKAKEAPVTLTYYEYELETIAESRAAYESYVRDEIVDARFPSSSTPDRVTSILRAITLEAGRLYTEPVPPSDGLETIMDEVGISEHMPETVPDDGWIEFDEFFFKFDGRYWNGSLNRKPT